MPVIYTGNHVCENAKCGKTFEWSYFKDKRQHINSSDLKPEPRPQGKTLVHICNQKDTGIYDIEVNCPYCGFDNRFEYTGV